MYDSFLLKMDIKKQNEMFNPRLPETFFVTRLPKQGWLLPLPIKTPVPQLAAVI